MAVLTACRGAHCIARLKLKIQFALSTCTVITSTQAEMTLLIAMPTPVLIFCMPDEDDRVPKSTWCTVKHVSEPSSISF